MNNHQLMSFRGKYLFLSSCTTIIVLHTLAQEHTDRLSFVNPTGTYVLKGKKSRDEIKGQFAEIRVKLLDHQTVALSSYFNKGYPDYSVEAFLDTLSYSYNACAFVHERDPYCKIIFQFSNSEVQLLYVFPDNGHQCIFSPGAIVTGKIEKLYDAVPIIAGLNRETATGSDD
jgi:hypothetical protein